MTDHADTIRWALDELYESETGVAEAQDARKKANAAADALVAERQQAIDERDAAIKRSVRLVEGQGLQEWMRELDEAETRNTALRVKLEQVIDERDYLIQASKGIQAERQQAIDERQDAVSEIGEYSEGLAPNDLVGAVEWLIAEETRRRIQLEQAIDALREAEHRCRMEIRRAAFSAPIGARFTEPLRLAIADECRKLEDGIDAALVKLGEKP